MAILVGVITAGTDEVIPAMAWGNQPPASRICRRQFRLLAVSSYERRICHCLDSRRKSIETHTRACDHGSAARRIKRAAATWNAADLVSALIVAHSSCGSHVRGLIAAASHGRLNAKWA
jgi:hypothetical protein